MKLPVLASFSLIFVLASWPNKTLADSSLDLQMERMTDAFRPLRAALADPESVNQQDLMNWTRELGAAAVASKDLQPEKVGEIPEENRVAFIEAYQQSLDELIILVDQLSDFILTEEWDAATNQIVLINQSQRNGHKKFRSEDH